MRNGVNCGRLFADIPRNTDQLFNKHVDKILCGFFSGINNPRVNHVHPFNIVIIENTIHVFGSNIDTKLIQRGLKSATNANLFLTKINFNSIDYQHLEISVNLAAIINAHHVYESCK